MVRVVRMGHRFLGIEEHNCEGNFWEDVRIYVENGEAVIIAEDKEEAEEICKFEIEWVFDDEEGEEDA